MDDDYFFTQKFTFKCRNESDMCLGGEAEFGSVSPMANLSVSRPGSFLSLDRLRVKSDGRVLAEVSLKTSEFSKRTVSAEDGRQEPGKPQPSFGKLGCQIKVPDTLTCNADIDVVNGPILRGSAVYVYNQVLAIGTQAVINTRLEESPKDFAPEVTDLGMSIAYQGPNWSLAVKSLDVFGGIKLEYLQKIPPKLAIGSSIMYNFQQGQQKAQQKLAFGVEYK